MTSQVKVDYLNKVIDLIQEATGISLSLAETESLNKEIITAHNNYEKAAMQEYFEVRNRRLS